MSVNLDIPPFSYPANRYANKLRKIFGVLGLDFSNTDIDKKYTSSIIAKCPDEIIMMLPDKVTMDVLLKSFDNFDAGTRKLNEVLDFYQLSDSSLSIDFKALCDKVVAVMT